jgi:hypothetical protein
MDRLQPNVLSYMLMMLFAFSALALLLVSTYLNRAILNMRAVFIVEIGSLFIFSEVLVLYIYVLGKTIGYWFYKLTYTANQSIDTGAFLADLIVVFLGFLLFAISYFFFIKA